MRARPRRAAALLAGALGDILRFHVEAPWHATGQAVVMQPTLATGVAVALATA